MSTWTTAPVVRFDCYFRLTLFKPSTITFESIFEKGVLYHNNDKNGIIQNVFIIYNINSRKYIGSAQRNLLFFQIAGISLSIPEDAVNENSFEYIQIGVSHDDRYQPTLNGKIWVLHNFSQPRVYFIHLRTIYSEHKRLPHNWSCIEATLPHVLYSYMFEAKRSFMTMRFKLTFNTSLMTWCIITKAEDL